jgi:hypothetical protein
MRNLKMPRSTFGAAVTPEFIIINDLDGPVSVTNDAENVVDYLRTRGLLTPQHKIIYEDTEGTWDQMLITPSMEFKDFRLLNAKTVSEAMTLARCYAE